MNIIWQWVIYPIDYNLVEEYWDALVEYEGAIFAARDIWQHVQPLYLKLHKYVTLKLRGADEVGKPLPVYLLSKLKLLPPGHRKLWK